MAIIYSDYSRARIGHFFGLSGWQLTVVALSLMPVLVSVNAGSWLPAAVFALAWALVVVVTVTPVRGRSATNWAATTLAFAVGSLTGWTRFRSRAAVGAPADLHVPDLPGVLAGVEIHDGPPQGPTSTRVAVVQDHTTRTWAVTAAVVHPGIGMSEADERARFGTGLSGLLDLASRTELVDEILLLVRSVPEDGAERDQWISRHRRTDAPAVARVVNDELQAALTGGCVRTEAFITLVVPESRLGRAAKEAGGGLEGRARVLYSLMSECDAQLRGAVGMTAVEWLTSPQLAAACRTGFAPGDRAGIIDALTAHASDPGVNADVPWALAGPSGADSLRAALQPRRVELGLGDGQAPRQGGGHGRAGAGAHPERAGGAALGGGRVPDHQRLRGGPAVREQRVGCRHGGGAAHQGEGQAPHQGGR